MRRGKTRKVSRFEWQQTFRIMCLEKKELQIRQTERRKETGLTNYSWSEKGDLSAQGKKSFSGSGEFVFSVNSFITLLFLH